jgi:transposase
MPAGRPKARDYSEQEVADKLDVSRATVQRWCSPPCSFFPGAQKGAEGWLIPETQLRSFLARRLEPHFSLRTLAGYLDASYDHIWRLYKAGKIKAVSFLGEIRVPESEALKLVTPEVRL